MLRVSLLLVVLLTPGCATYLAHDALAARHDETVPDEIHAVVACRVAAHGDIVACHVRAVARSGRHFDYVLDDRGLEGPCGAALDDPLEGVPALHLVSTSGEVEAGAFVVGRDARLSREEARTGQLLAFHPIPPGIELLTAPPGGRAPSGTAFSTADDARRWHHLRGPPGTYRRATSGPSPAGLALFCLATPFTAALDVATSPIQLAVYVLFLRRPRGGP